MKIAEITEGFVSQSANLNNKQLEDLFKKKFGQKIKIVHSKFLKFDKKNDQSVYKIASLDNETDEYIINDLYVSHYLPGTKSGGIEVDDVSPVPDESFTDLAKAKAYVEKATK